MVKVEIFDWNYGFKKVQMTLLQIEELKLGLTESKTNTDRILDKHATVYTFNSLEKAEDFLKKATALGAIARILEN